eukprot:scaffold65012_cov66-Phaeocystis_antarctica.AAC.2
MAVMAGDGRGTAVTSRCRGIGSRSVFATCSGERKSPLAVSSFSVIWIGLASKPVSRISVT